MGVVSPRRHLEKQQVWLVYLACCVDSDIEERFSVLSYYRLGAVMFTMKFIVFNYQCPCLR